MAFASLPITSSRANQQIPGYAMKIILAISILVTTIICVLACREKHKFKTPAILIQPFSDLDRGLTDTVFSQLAKMTTRISVKKPIELPKNAFYAPRNRFRADSLIHMLSQLTNADTVIIGLTSKDISVTKGKFADWGIMGLAYCPGRACVVSHYRVSGKDLTQQLYILAAHELGHTQGLRHCSEKFCFMRDAEGGNPLNQETGFCDKCKIFLAGRGWILN